MRAPKEEYGRRARRHSQLSDAASGVDLRSASVRPAVSWLTTRPLLAGMALSRPVPTPDPFRHEPQLRPLETLGAYPDARAFTPLVYRFDQDSSPADGLRARPRMNRTLPDADQV
jgi:hypothetical protein